MTYTDYMLDPNVCPSSLNEDGVPMDENETAHRWEQDIYPQICAECGTIREETKCTCQCGNEHMGYQD